MNRPRLLILTLSFRPEVGGVETRLNDLCDYLKKHNYQTTIITYQPIITGGRGLPVEQDGCITIHRYRWPGRNLFHKLLGHPILEVLYIVPGLLFWAFIFMFRHAREIDTIHTLGLNCSIIGRILKTCFRKRWVMTTHAIYDFDPKSLFARVTNSVLKSADKVIALSEPSRKELLQIGLPEDKVTTHLTWVNQDRFCPGDRAAARNQLDLPPDMFTVLYVGRLLKIKGIETLLELATDMPDTQFVFAGQGELDDRLADAASTNANVTFLGGVDNDRLPPVYQAADVFVMPSQYREGLGRVSLEALSCGLPLIASNLGGIVDYVDDSCCILLNPTQENLKQAIDELRANPERLHQMQEAARSLALRQFSEENAETLVTHYAIP